MPEIRSDAGAHAEPGIMQSGWRRRYTAHKPAHCLLHTPRSPSSHDTDNARENPLRNPPRQPSSLRRERKQVDAFSFAVKDGQSRRNTHSDGHRDPADDAHIRPSRS